MKLLPEIFSDLHKTIDWLLQSQEGRILEKSINLFGRSLGGAIILTEGFIDKRVRKIIACCTRYDYHSVAKIRFPEEVITKISPMYFLKKETMNKSRILIAHCRDDKQIPFKNLKLIKKRLDLPDDNVLIYSEGGHSFRGHREDLFQEALKCLKS
ncbi:MAG: hypothetical protein EU547_04755 [Promethearchaeota archaeon]|nr:MAG: hypothetical protein EU547_04755 [Candidatus Lokiarchaeota archaeon]